MSLVCLTQMSSEDPTSRVQLARNYRSPPQKRGGLRPPSSSTERQIIIPTSLDISQRTSALLHSSFPDVLYALDERSASGTIFDHDGLIPQQFLADSMSGHSGDVGDQSVANGDHVCRFCRKSFLCKTHLDRHERIHTGEKPFACPHCQYRASQKGSVKRHIFMVHRDIFRN